MRHVRQRLKALVRGGSDKALNRARGVIHVGANTGQERGLYAAYGLKVIWVEPIPEVFDVLQSNIAEYPDQRAVRALLTDRSGETVTFHVSSNDGLSSSIFDFDQHKDIWPEVTTSRSLELTTTTLAELIEHERVDPTEYDALVMDTQGSELLVLQGAEQLLEGFSIIKTEAADFDSYKGCCLREDIENYLSARGFTETRCTEFARSEQGGRYYDIIFERL